MQLAYKMQLAKRLANTEDGSEQIVDSGKSDSDYFFRVFNLNLPVDDD